jgi:hypothetical protein
MISARLAGMPPWLFEAQQLGLGVEPVLDLRIECLPVGLCTHQTGCLGRTLCCQNLVSSFFRFKKKPHPLCEGRGSAVIN